MRKGAIGLILSTDIFPPVEFTTANFVGSIILRTAEDPTSPTIGWRLTPYQSPTQVSLCWDILFRMFPGTPHHEHRCPK